MIDCDAFYDALRESGVGFFAGVPDSLLKQICACITQRAESSQHVITANEGAAVALAAGHHLATAGLPLVYLQNSGLGNTINPLTSLADPEVYAIPMLLLLGWRGEPGVADEPQHVQQGAMTCPMLDVLGIPTMVLPTELAPARATVEQATADARQRSGPVALVVRKNTFAAYRSPTAATTCTYTMTREQVLCAILDSIGADSIVVSTTGKTSREVFEHRVRQGQPHHADFLTVGSMGHASQIALGIAMARPDRQVWVLDGDGALIMHMGSLGIAAAQDVPNYRHVVINNGAHESVGGQPTVGFSLDLPSIAQACGYRQATAVSSEHELAPALSALAEATGPSLLEIRVRVGSRPDLGRPTLSPVENKLGFMKNLLA